MEQNLSLEQNQSLEQILFQKIQINPRSNLTFDEDIHLNKILKPKLAIIIDDMANASQVRGLKALN